jgi:hypothetical protein
MKQQAIEKKKEIMEQVFASLNKKDSLVVLLEQYEGSLHKADKVTDSPRDDEHLVLKEDADEDEYSKLTELKKTAFQRDQPKPIDKKIVTLSTKIRN